MKELKCLSLGLLFLFSSIGSTDAQEVSNYANLKLEERNCYHGKYSNCHSR